MSRKTKVFGVFFPSIDILQRFFSLLVYMFVNVDLSRCDCAYTHVFIYLKMIPFMWSKEEIASYNIVYSYIAFQSIKIMSNMKKW